MRIEQVLRLGSPNHWTQCFISGDLRNQIESVAIGLSENNNYAQAYTRIFTFFAA